MNSLPGALGALTVVFFNALSGTILSVRKDRVRWTTGLTYGLLSLPLVGLGSYLQGTVGRADFAAGHTSPTVVLRILAGLLFVVGVGFFLP